MLEICTRDIPCTMMTINNVMNCATYRPEIDFWISHQKNENDIINELFFNCYLAVPRPTFGHSQRDSLTNSMLITAFVNVQPKGYWEPRSEVGTLNPAKHLADFELRTFRFWIQRQIYQKMACKILSQFKMTYLSISKS